MTVQITRTDLTARELRAAATKSKDARACRQWVRYGPDPTTDGVVRWRRVDLKRTIEERFGVVMHTLGKQ